MCLAVYMKEINTVFAIKKYFWLADMHKLLDNRHLLSTD